MTRTGGTVAALAVLAIIGLLALAPQPAFAEFPVVCGRNPPVSVANVQGFTWTGTVTDLGPARAIVFRVDHVYSENHQSDSAPPPESLEAGRSIHLGNRTCNPITGLEIGHRYVVSTFGIGTAGPISGETAVWELEGNHARFLHMYETDRVLARALPAADTLTEVIRLVAPGAELPPTDTAQQAGGDSPHPSPWLLLAAAAAFAFFIKRPLRTRKL
jgi:hypothetical protein